MTIHIEALTFDVIIGLLDFERERPQKVSVDLEIVYPYADKNFIDYADVALMIEEELKTKKYLLLEEALEGVKAILRLKYPQMNTLRLKISKPDIVSNCSVGLSESWDF